MASSLKRRLDRLSEKVKPQKYARVDELIHLTHLRRRTKSLTDEERLRLSELESLPVHPKLLRAFERLENKRKQKAQSATISH